MNVRRPNGPVCSHDLLVLSARRWAVFRTENRLPGEIGMLLKRLETGGRKLAARSVNLAFNALANGC